MTYTGVDLSHYQSNISMSGVRAAGHSFVILKASESTGYTDPAFRAQAANAHAAGLLVSSYHFLRAGQGAAQAAHFLATIAGVIPQNVRVWADYEIDASHQDLHDFTTAVAAAGRPVGVYTYPAWWAAHGSTTCAHCASLPLWYARYGPQPTCPAPWKTYALWQFTDSAVVAGVSVDLSRTEDLSVFTGGVAPAPAPAPKPVPPKRFPEDDMFTFSHAGGVYLVTAGKVIPIEDTKYLPSSGPGSVPIPTMGPLDDRQYALLMQGLGLTA